MLKKHKLASPIKHILMLIAIPLVLTSTGYALFSQQLSIDANADNPAYSSSDNLLLTYTRTVTQVGASWQYDISATIKNTSSTRSLSAWQATFSLPADYSNVVCANANCSQANGINTAVNTGTNGSIAASGSVNFSFSFQSAQQNYVFPALTVSGTLVPIYQPVSGLTATNTTGTRTQSGSWYTWPFTFTVTNNSGQDLAGWRLLIPWDTTTNQVSSMPSTVDYVESSTQLTIMSKQALVNGTSFQFTANLSSTDPNYVLPSYSVEGQF